ncbi:hypothetical protein BRC64_04195 [Halobacteriales archaeon QH_10_67_22]|nr:MAG: hypothetical protein BRC64_04195 [Halobacteriales archaeon QH_10_67_22]
MFAWTHYRLSVVSESATPAERIPQWWDTRQEQRHPIVAGNELVTRSDPGVGRVMTEHRVPGDKESVVAVGQALGPESAPDDILPAIVREHADGTERYIAYSAVVDDDSVDDYWFSIDLGAVVSRELWR